MIIKKLDKKVKKEDFTIFPNNNYLNEYECCRDCPNNPKNGGSGICQCILPLVEKPIT